MAEGRGPGLVSIVGAGPGDPGLLTIRGRRAVERADLVLYDRLASPALLASVEVPGQERIHVGKTASEGLSQQERINALMVRRALAGERVVRLKGGDPMIFGRGGEEMEACVEAGVPFEVVPGVSSISAVPAFAGVPLTHRDAASVFTVVTGHERGPGEPEEARVDWEALGRVGGSLVVLMGVHQAARWSQALMRGGRARDTPVLATRWGTTPRQRTLETTLGELAGAVHDEAFRPPAVVVVGDVVRYRAALSWFEARPLMGQVVGVTRSGRDDASEFEALEALGAAVVHVPLTRQVPVDDGRPLADAVRDGDFSDLVLTSQNGVHALCEALVRSGRDVRTLAGVTTWAVGPATARAMRSMLALGADHVASPATGEGLVAMARELGVQGRRFLFPSAAAAREVVPEGLRALGAELRQIAAYATEPDPLAAPRLESAFEQGLSLLAIASPSAVDALEGALRATGRGVGDVALAAIGPTTAEHARARGFDVAVTAETHTMTGLAAAITERLSRG
ncbi:MAG: uroporphyrinogen-III C-methyltransferase [Deltaproteobacteria bacterium]|nr:uroporphyrinogen-III C-methyltransferase [Deltaproteobacteria bacterium]MCB9788191.1 uroporphyrinogen-III C-methyltransferase [Deltaproteobacteria bacterium]